MVRCVAIVVAGISRTFEVGGKRRANRGARSGNRGGQSNETASVTTIYKSPRNATGDRIDAETSK